MRKVLGILLHLNGSAFFALGHVGWGMTCAASLLEGELSASGMEWLVTVAFFAAAATLVVMGELMSLFGLAMADPGRPAWHGSKPLRWFGIHGMLSLTTSTLVGAIIAIPVSIVRFGPETLRPYPALVVWVLALGIRQHLEKAARRMQFE